MTTPDLDLDDLIPRSVVAWPQWGRSECQILSEFQDPRSPDPEWEVYLPSGAITLIVGNSTRFSVNVILTRSGSSSVLDTIPSGETKTKFFSADNFGVETIRFEIVGSASTNDRVNTRVVASVICIPPAI